MLTPIEVKDPFPFPKKITGILRQPKIMTLKKSYRK